MGDGSAEVQKMEALKRAYAAIILNTAKEAAARVLAADRRAAQLERCLSMLKEESIALLLRVKAVMDNKIKEAEKVKLSQARKIHGLQIKLCEAEDTIGTLRSELKKVHSNTENNKSNQAKAGATSMLNVDIKHAATSEDKDGNYCFMKGPSHLIISDDCTVKPDLASIILTNKEQESYQNGCTQRIRAFEHNLLTRRKHLAVSDEQFPKMEGKAVKCENGRVGRSTSENCLMADKTSQVKASLDSKKDGHPGNINENDYALKICTWRRRRRMRRKGIMRPRSFGILTDMAASELIDGNHSIAGETSDTTRSIETTHARTSEVSRGSLNSYMSQKSMEDVKTSKGICIELKESLSRQTSGLPTGQTATESSETCLKSHSGVDIKYNSGNASEEDNQNKLLLFSLVDTNDSSLLDEGRKQEVIGENVVEHERLKKDFCNVVDGFTYSQKENHETDLVLEKGESRDDKSCRTCTLPAEDPTDNIVKYRRKRKRASLEAKKEIVSLEKSDSTGRKLDIENHLLDPRKTSTVIDSSSRDSRRLVQVARQHQLYSLDQLHISFPCPRRNGGNATCQHNANGTGWGL